MCKDNTYFESMKERKEKGKAFEDDLGYIREGSGHCEKNKWMENWERKIGRNM